MVDVAEEEVPKEWFEEQQPKRARTTAPAPAPAAIGASASSSASAAIGVSNSALAAIVAAASSAPLARHEPDDNVLVRRALLQMTVGSTERASKAAAHAVHISRAARDGFEDPGWGKEQIPHDKPWQGNGQTMPGGVWWHVPTSPPPPHTSHTLPSLSCHTDLFLAPDIQEEQRRLGDIVRELRRCLG